MFVIKLTRIQGDLIQQKITKTAEAGGPCAEVAAGTGGARARDAHPAAEAGGQEAGVAGARGRGSGPGGGVGEAPPSSHLRQVERAAPGARPCLRRARGRGRGRCAPSTARL